MSKLLRTLILIPSSAAMTAFAVNNDGITDVYWRDNAALTNAAWWLNNYSTSASNMIIPGKQVPLPPTGADGPWTMVGTADFDKDGQLDILWFHTGWRQLAYWYMRGTGIRSTALVSWVADSGWSPVGTGYFGGPTDSKADILWYNTNTAQVAVWHMNNTNLTSANVVGVVAPTTWKIGGAADMDHDGDYDIVFHNESVSDGSHCYWKLAGGTETNSLQYAVFLTQTQPDTNYKLMGVNYFNRDDEPDLFWRITGGPNVGKCVVWHYNGTNYLSSRTLDLTVGSHLSFGGLGDSMLDADADGMPDLWERRYFGTRSHSAATNSDADGWTDFQEYRDGTDPTLNDSPLFRLTNTFTGVTQNEPYTAVVSDTMGAIGYTNFLEIVNRKLVAFDRASKARIAEINASAFFGIGTTNSVADPRVWYDYHSHRWIACMMDGPTRVVALKVSLSPSAGLDSGNWVRHTFTNTVAAGESIDFPTLGVDKNGIYISLQFHSNSVHRGYRIQPFKKPEVFSSTYVLPVPLSVTNVKSGSFTGDLEAAAIQPAYNFDDALASNGNVWLIAKGRRDTADDTRTLCYRRLQWSGTNTFWADADWQVIAGNYLDYYDVPHQTGAGPLAPTSGSSIDLGRGGSRLTMAVIRKVGTAQFLWTCHHVGLDGPDSSYNGGQIDRSAIQWLKLQVNSSTLTYTTHNRIFDDQVYSGLNTPHWYYFPSLNVNSVGDIVVAFSGARTAEHVSSYYWGRKSSGSTNARPFVLTPGQLDINTQNWTDYSATTMDPNDDSFWTVQPYAIREAGSDPIGALWGTAISQIVTYP